MRRVGGGTSSASTGPLLAEGAAGMVAAKAATGRAEWCCWVGCGTGEVVARAATGVAGGAEWCCGVVVWAAASAGVVAASAAAEGTGGAKCCWGGSSKVGHGTEEVAARAATSAACVCCPALPGLDLGSGANSNAFGCTAACV